MARFRYAIGLGSNLGSRAQFLAAAADLLADRGAQVEARARLFETAAVGPGPQPDFLNSAIRIATDLSPLDLLGVLQGIERDLGRERRIRWGARTIDLDILLWSEGPFRVETLVVPHPYLCERPFALAPLIDVWPQAAAEYAAALASLGGPPRTAQEPFSCNAGGATADDDTIARAITERVSRTNPGLGPLRVQQQPIPAGEGQAQIRTAVAAIPRDLVPTRVALGPAEAGARTCFFVGRSGPAVSSRRLPPAESSKAAPARTNGLFRT